MPSQYRNWIVTDFGFGDSRKGGTVDFLTRHIGAGYPVVNVRANGGPQAAHNVVDIFGRRHQFSQYGSGAMAGATTWLSRYMLVSPSAFFNETKALHALGVPVEDKIVIVDPDARIITPYHQIANRLIEIHRGANRHGSCGMGIGETMSDWIEYPEDTLYGRMLKSKAEVAALLRRVRDRKIEKLKHIIGDLKNHPLAADEINGLFSDGVIPATMQTYRAFEGYVRWMDVSQMRRHVNEMSARLIFEGAQGVLIDELYGFNPHTTWSTTTSANAVTLINDLFHTKNDTHRIGVTRTYMARHGAGPLPTEFRDDDGNPLPVSEILEPHNVTNHWQGPMRYGALDFELLRYAVEANGGVDSIGVSHLDHIAPLNYHGQGIQDTFTYAVGYLNADGEPVRLKLPTTLEESEQNTRIVNSVIPLMRSDDCDDVYGSYIPQLFMDNLNVPVSMLSTGPRSVDQTWIAP